MSFTPYAPVPTKLVTLTRADGAEPLNSATTNVSLEQLADGVAWLNNIADNLYSQVHTWTALQTFQDGVAISGGSISFTGTQPAAGADPGANVANALTQSRAWGKITCNGLGAVTVDDNLGIASASVTSTYVQLTFARAFAGANYAPTITSLDGTTVRHYQSNASTMTGTTLRVHVFDSAGAVVDPTANICRFSIDAKGRQ